MAIFSSPRKLDHIVIGGLMMVDMSIEAVIAKHEAEIENEKSLAIKAKEDANRHAMLAELDEWRYFALRQRSLDCQLSGLLGKFFG